MFKRTPKPVCDACRSAAWARPCNNPIQRRLGSNLSASTAGNTSQSRIAWSIGMGLFAFGTTFAIARQQRPLLLESPVIDVPSLGSRRAGTSDKTSEAPSSDQSTLPLSSMPAISYDLSPENLASAASELRVLLGEARVSDNVAECVAHSSTAWSPAPRGELDRPALVVRPRTTEEVSGVCRVCHARRIPMIGFSGGTSLEGTLAAVHGGVCVDFQLMDRVLAVNDNDVDCVVQPGVDYRDLNEVLARDHGLFFPPDPGPGARIGGMISQGCSGTNAFRYGTVKDWVLGLTVVLADGTIIKTRGRPRKSSAGFNLTQLMISSEGTLGFVTEANLKLTSVPRNERVAVAAFPTTHDAVATAVRVVKSGMPIAAMEMLCDVTMRAVNEGGYCDKEYAETPTLFFKFAADSPTTVAEQISNVQSLAAKENCQTFESSETEEEASSIWEARKTILWSLLTLKNDPDDDFLSSDTAVPIGRLAEAVEAARSIAQGHGFITSFLGHVGDGNFHTSVLYAPQDRKKAREVITAIQRKAIEMDGTVTGEHGIGLEFRDMVNEELGDSAVDAMRMLKMAWDPRGLMNPNKLFRLNIVEQEQQK